MLYFLITKVLLQPMPLLFLLAVAAFANLWRRKKENRGRLLFLGIPLALLILASTPAVVYPFVGDTGMELSPRNVSPDRYGSNRGPLGWRFGSRTRLAKSPSWQSTLSTAVSTPPSSTTKGCRVPSS